MSTQIKVNYNNCALWPGALFTNSCSVFSSRILRYTFVLICVFLSDNGPGMEKWRKNGILRQPDNKQSLQKLLRCEGKSKDNDFWTWHQDAQSYCEVIVDLAQHRTQAQRLLIQVFWFFFFPYCVYWTIMGLSGCISKFCVGLITHLHPSTYPCLTLLSTQLSLVSTLIMQYKCIPLFDYWATGSALSHLEATLGPHKNQQPSINSQISLKIRCPQPWMTEWCLSIRICLGREVFKQDLSCQYKQKTKLEKSNPLFKQQQQYKVVGQL